MARVNCDVSIFSNARNCIGFCQNKFCYYFLIFLPYICFVIFACILNFALRPKVYNLFSNNFDFNLAVLTSSGINIVLITSIAYFYREIILKIQDENKIREGIGKIMNKVEFTKGNEALVDDFIDASVADLKEVLNHPRRIIRYLHKNLYIIELILIFTSLCWSMLDFLLSSIKFNFWIRNSFFFGFSISFMLLSFIAIHGFVMLGQFILRRKIAESISTKSIISQWELFKKELKAITPDQIIESDIEEINKVLGL